MTFRYRESNDLSKNGYNMILCNLVANLLKFKDWYDFLKFFSLEFHYVLKSAKKGHFVNTVAACYFTGYIHIFVLYININYAYI